MKWILILLLLFIFSCDLKSATDLRERIEKDVETEQEQRE